MEQDSCDLSGYTDDRGETSVGGDEKDKPPEGKEYPEADTLGPHNEFEAAVPVMHQGRRSLRVQRVDFPTLT